MSPKRKNKRPTKVEIKDQGGEPDETIRAPEPSPESESDTPADAAKDDNTSVIEQELDDLRQRFQRLGADFQNYQKRSHRQLDQTAQMAREEIALSLLGVLDNFEHTLEKGRHADQVDAVLEGINIVYDHLLSALSRHGLQRIKIEPGEAFDPMRHEAMLQEESEQWPENSILRELAPGYVMKDRTLRPAKVSVVKPIMEREETTPAEEKKESGRTTESADGADEYPVDEEK